MSKTMILSQKNASILRKMSLIFICKAIIMAIIILWYNPSEKNVSLVNLKIFCGRAKNLV